MLVTNHFGNRIRELRNARGITLVTLASHCGVHKNLISSIERGERNNLKVETLWRICVGMDAAAEDLISHWVKDREQGSSTEEDSSEETSDLTLEALKETHDN